MSGDRPLFRVFHWRSSSSSWRPLCNPDRDLDSGEVVASVPSDVTCRPCRRLMAERSAPSPIPRTGEDLRDEGVAAVSGAEDRAGEWRELAFAAVLELAASGLEFNADDVRDRVGAPERPNAMGAVFLRAARAGLLVQVGFRKRARPESHAQKISVYVGSPEALARATW